MRDIYIEKSNSYKDIIEQNNVCYDLLITRMCDWGLYDEMELNLL